jgi:hypothetical protein
MITYRNVDLEVLTEMAAFLKVEGFSVSPIVSDFEDYEHRVPYFHTNASGHDIMRVRREVGRSYAGKKRRQG